MAGLSFGGAMDARLRLANEKMDVSRFDAETRRIAATRPAPSGNTQSPSGRGHPSPDAVKSLAEQFKGATTPPAATPAANAQTGGVFANVPVGGTSLDTAPVSVSDNDWNKFASGFAQGGAVAPAPVMAMHPLYKQYLSAMHNAGMLQRVEPPEAVLPRMAQQQAQKRMAMAQQTNAGGTMGYAAGGAVDTAGSQITGPGTGKSDSIPAVIDGQKPSALSNGEFHIPRNIVEYYGTKFFDTLVEKARTAGRKQAIARG